MTGISQQFCVRWNSHLGSLGAAFPQLLAGQQFVDVTLACDGHQVHCHRLVLAACSSYFESLLSENPCKHPIIILPKDIKLWEIHALVDFMYKGQVNVSQAGLPELLKCAETLQIRGLCGTESSLNEVANGKIDGRCDSNVLSNNCSPNFNFTSMFASNLMNANYQSDEEQSFRQQHSDMQQRSMFLAADIAKASNHRETLAKTKPHKNAHTDKATKEPCNPTLNTTKNILKRLSENEASNTCSSELNIKCEEVEDSDANAADDGIDDDLDEHSNSKQSEYTMQQNDMMIVDNDSLVICDGSKETTIASHNGSNQSTQIHDIFINDDDSTSITKNDSNDDMNSFSPSWSLNGESDAKSGRLEDSSRDFECDTMASKLPTSLKFNRNTMSIFVKRTTDKSADDRFAAEPVSPPLIRANQQNFHFNDDSESIICSPTFREDMQPMGSGRTDKGHFKSLRFGRNSKKIFSKIYRYDNALGTKDKQSDRLMEFLDCNEPMQSAVVLRSPRGNQPRTYTTDALYSALMDVKSGESIYRASQIHGVPRKTLRNWMKRWHIKSVYPMPYQLKRAAEKKRQTVQKNETQASTSAQRDSPEIIESNDC